MSNICSFFLSSLAVLSVEPGTEGCPLVFYGKQKFYYAQAQPTHFQYFCLYLLLFKFYFVILFFLKKMIFQNQKQTHADILLICWKKSEIMWKKSH